MGLWGQVCLVQLSPVQCLLKPLHRLPRPELVGYRTNPYSLSGFASMIHREKQFYTACRYFPAIQDSIPPDLSGGTCMHPGSHYTLGQRVVAVFPSVRDNHRSSDHSWVARRRADHNWIVGYTHPPYTSVGCHSLEAQWCHSLTLLYFQYFHP